MLSQKNKKIIIISSSIFFSFIAVCLILVLLNFASKGFWERGLKQSIETTLEQKYGSVWTIGNRVNTKKLLISDIQIFECAKNRGDRTKYFALIIRTPSQAGPLPTVFLCTKDDCQFVGYALENAKMTKILERTHPSSHLVYWQTKFPQILNKAGVFDD